MSSGGNYPVYVTDTDPWELKPPKSGPRSTLFLQNTSANSVYVNEDSIANADNAIELGAGLTLSYTVSDGPVPQGTIWITGSQVARQRVLTRQA